MLQRAWICLLKNIFFLYKWCDWVPFKNTSINGMNCKWKDVNTCQKNVHFHALSVVKCPCVFCFNIASAEFHPWPFSLPLNIPRSAAPARYASLLISPTARNAHLQGSSCSLVNHRFSLKGLPNAHILKKAHEFIMWPLQPIDCQWRRNTGVWTAPSNVSRCESWNARGGKRKIKTHAFENIWWICLFKV